MQMYEIMKNDASVLRKKKCTKSATFHFKRLIFNNMAFDLFLNVGKVFK